MAIPKGLALVVVLAFISCFLTISEAQWCVANPQISDQYHKRDIDTLCANGGINQYIEDSCKQIQPGAPCFDPDRVKFHVSVLYNAYYQSRVDPDHCYHDNGRAILTFDDPSTDTCLFELNTS